MVFVVLLGLIEIALAVQCAVGVRDYRRRCTGEPRPVYWPRPFYHAPLGRQPRTH